MHRYRWVNQVFIEFGVRNSTEPCETLIHVECHRDRLTKTPERLSRHWYDLCMLTNSWVGEQAVAPLHQKYFLNA